jgi:ABC-type transport system involved in multi-copper enzyme maturation permease subunit
MRLFPIVTREMRVASRKWATYWNRSVLAFGAIIVALWAMLVFTRAMPKNSGFPVFVALAVVASIYCALIGLFFTSDCLAEEKREGTLGLLFLTDLKGYDVVFGKLVASSLRGVYSLFAIFPVIGLCLLLGGVSAAEFIRLTVTCLNTLFLSLALGMFASAVCRDERKAMALSFLLMLLLTAGMPALAGYLRWKLHLTSTPLAVLALSPGHSTWQTFHQFYKPEQFTITIVTQHALAWLLLGISCVAVPRSWQDKAATAGAMRRRANWRQWVYGPPAVRAAFRRRLLEVNPYCWVAARDRFKQTLPWIWLSVAGVLWLLGLAQWPNEWRDDGTYVFTAIVLHSLFKIWIATEAAQRLGSDRQSGALELLLSTPISVSEILRGQWLALVRQFAAPAAIVCIADIIFLCSSRSLNNANHEWLMLCCAGITVFILDLVTLSWTGMWLGLVSRRTGQGGVWALVQICVLPWCAFFLFGALMILFEEFNIMRTHRIERWVIPIWWSISVSISLFFGVTAFRRLHRDLRLLATERYVGRGAMIGRALGVFFGRLCGGALTQSAGRAAGAGASIPPRIGG